jgi:hypothetical protein
MKKYLFIMLLTLNLGGVAFAQKAQYVEVLYFHRTNRCSTCQAIEKVTNEYINTEFSQEVASGDVTFNSIDFQLESLNALVEKYSIEGPTLLIIHHMKKKDLVYDLTEVAFANADSNPTILKAEIKDKIDEFFR